MCFRALKGVSRLSQCGFKRSQDCFKTVSGNPKAVFLVFSVVQVCLGLLFSVVQVCLGLLFSVVSALRGLGGAPAHSARGQVDSFDLSENYSVRIGDS